MRTRTSALPGSPIGDEPDADEDVRAPRFAYWDGSQLVVTGEGTLTAYDVMGRQLFRMELPTAYYPLSTSLFPGTGVYILRLNGQSQKIVIR